MAAGDLRAVILAMDSVVGSRSGSASGGSAPIPAVRGSATARAVVLPDAVVLLRGLKKAGVPTVVIAAGGDDTRALAESTVVQRIIGGAAGSGDVLLGHAADPADPADPVFLLECAQQLGFPPDRVAVVQGSAEGVAGARRSGFGLVVGVDREGIGERLRAAGADLVVADLREAEHRLGAWSRLWAGGASREDPWLLRYRTFEPDAEGVREALCTLGNGYWGTRGAAAEAVQDPVHNPGTYLAGVYDRVPQAAGDVAASEEHLVNAPNWLGVRFAAEGMGWFHPGTARLSTFDQVLDLRRSLLTRSLRYWDDTDRSTTVVSTRFVSQADPHLAVSVTVLEAQDWAGWMTVRSELDGRVANRSPAMSEPGTDRHLIPRDGREADPETVLLETETAHSGIRIALAARTRLWAGAERVRPPMRFLSETGWVASEFRVWLQPGLPLRIEKVVAVTTSRDRAIASPGEATVSRLLRAPDAEDLQSEHQRGWALRWDEFAVTVDAGRRHSLAVNLDTFHVLQTIGAADADIDAGLPARGLHGEGYRGHVFWDEMFVYPMITLRRPDLSRALLGYRYRRLDEARAAARAAGHEGAMFPWQSGTDGREATPDRLYNPFSRRWTADNSSRQRHVGLAVAYSVWRYYQATGDIEYLEGEGAELMIEVARFFASLATYDDSADRYDITGVMGPDEFHDGPPDAPGTGLRNNGYTNVMAGWVLSRTVDLLTLLDGRYTRPLHARLQLRPEEIDRWRHISTRLRLSFLPDGVLSQFEGYEILPELDWGGYRRKYRSLRRLDLILNAEGDSTNRYRVSKQADVLMLLYLLSAEELREVVENMGYELPPAAVAATVAHYSARTTHGSTLSEVVHAWVEVRRNRTRSWNHAVRALQSDTTDDPDRGTRDGIHLGAMAGSVDLMIRCYTGLEIRDDKLWLHPSLPPELRRIAFFIVYRQQPIRIEVTSAALRVSLDPGGAPPTALIVDGVHLTLSPGTERLFPLDPGHAPSGHGRGAGKPSSR